MHPIGNGNGPDVTSLSAQVYDCPVPFALLKVAEVSRASSWRRSPQASNRARSARSRLPLTCSRSGDCRSACPCSAVNQLPSLTPSFFTPFDSPYSRGQVGAEQSAFCRLVPRTAHCPEAKVDGTWREIARLQMHSVPDDYGFAERESRLGAIPLHEIRQWHADSRAEHRGRSGC
jgi:hypothetical protein